MGTRTWAVLAIAALIGAIIVWYLAYPCDLATPASPAVVEPSRSEHPEDFGHVVRAHQIAADRPDLGSESIEAELNRSDAIVTSIPQIFREGERISV